jgi:hypothetical protein
MSEPWVHAGGAAWLDAVLYDGALPEPDVLLDGDVSRSDGGASDAERGVLDRSQPPLLGVPTRTGSLRASSDDGN